VLLAIRRGTRAGDETSLQNLVSDLEPSLALDSRNEKHWTFKRAVLPKRSSLELVGSYLASAVASTRRPITLGQLLCCAIEFILRFLLPRKAW
jgi:hypothetical protein